MAETISTNQFKNGMHISVDNIVYRIVEFQHVKPGKGPAFVRTKLKALESGKVVDRTFRAGESMPRILTTVSDVQYLYDDGQSVNLMNTDNYEQFTLDHDLVADDIRWVKEGDVVQLLFVDGKPSSLQVPASVELDVTQTEPAVKGDTVSNVTKAATLENGSVVQVPSFVAEGDRIKVDTRDGRYIQRV